MRRCFYHTDLGQNAVFHNFAIQIGLSRKLRPRKLRPQTSDLENSDLENTDLKNSDLENTDLENSVHI